MIFLTIVCNTMSRRARGESGTVKKVKRGKSSYRFYWRQQRRELKLETFISKLALNKCLRLMGDHLDQPKQLPVATDTGTRRDIKLWTKNTTKKMRFNRMPSPNRFQFFAFFRSNRRAFAYCVLLRARLCVFLFFVFVSPSIGFGSHRLRHNYNAVRCYECVEWSMISFHVSSRSRARIPMFARWPRLQHKHETSGKWFAPQLRTQLALGACALCSIAHWDRPLELRIICSLSSSVLLPASAFLVAAASIYCLLQMNAVRYHFQFCYFRYEFFSFFFFFEMKQASISFRRRLRVTCVRIFLHICRL